MSSQGRDVGFAFYLCIYFKVLLLIYCWAWALLLRTFLQLWRVGATLGAVSGLLIAVLGVCAATSLLLSQQSADSSSGSFSSCGFGAPEHRLSSCGTQVQLPCSMWDLSRPGIKPLSSALAGRFFTTEPPGKPSFAFSYLFIQLQHVGSSSLTRDGTQVPCIGITRGVSILLF